VKVTPLFELLHGEQRFEALLRKMALL
jgi:hypothetical protein